MAKLLTGFDVISCFSELLRRVNPLLTVICLQCVDSFVGPWNLRPKCRSALSPSRSSITPSAIERAQKSCLENTRYKLSELPCICHQQRLNSREIYLFLQETMGLLATFEDEVFQMWNLSISKKMAQSLKGSLIIRTQDEKSTLRVNFSRDLSSLLREVSPYSECVIPAFYSISIFFNCQK